jgi:hypothetical protein
MAKIPEEGKGVLFSYEKKNPKAPDYKGSIMVNGNEIKISAWKRQSAYGELISLVHDTFKPTQQYPREVNHANDDEIPF